MSLSMIWKNEPKTMEPKPGSLLLSASSSRRGINAFLQAFCASLAHVSRNVIVRLKISFELADGLSKQK